MQTDRINEDDERAQAGQADRADAKAQAAILACVLSEHPETLSLIELAREMVSERRGYHSREVHDRAIKELVRVGLLCQQGEHVVPTPAALAYYRLELE